VKIAITFVVVANKQKSKQGLGRQKQNGRTDNTGLPLPKAL
jgi:hypothetical protein